MLPESHLQCYGEFRQALENLKEQLAQGDLNQMNLTAESQKIHLFFRDQICLLRLDDLAQADSQVSQSYQVEMDKQLRLLAVDVMFLEAAKQPQTVQQRRNALEDRLQMLIAYCNTLLKLTKESAVNSTTFTDE